MKEHLLVSTECPTCGAPLDFPEGSTAVVCSHCKSKLLVTGRKQVLSFAIRPKVTKEAALALAIKERRGRITLCDLYFVPYYRFTAHDYLCVSGEQRQSRGVGTERIALPSVPEESEDFFDKLADHPLVELTAKKDLVELLMDLLDWLVAVAGTFFGRARSAIAPAAASMNTGSLPIPTLDTSRARAIDVDSLEVTSRHL
ncbi:MAG TPA: hypothetical protein VIL97_04470, partial [Thermoanaerobaculia bacterium]